MTSPRLRMISGVVSDVLIHSGEEEFVRSPSQRAAGGAAAGLAAIGLAGAAAGASIAAAASGDPVELFTCKIGGETVSGGFSKVSFKEGDELDMVQINEFPHDLILAARRRADRLLWMVPHCSRGTGAHRTFSLRLFAWIATLSFILGMLWYLGFAFFSNTGIEIDGLEFVTPICLALAATTGLYYAIRFFFQWRNTARQAESIFATLGYLDPPYVDLERDHKLYCKLNGIKWPYPSDGPWIYHYLDKSVEGK
ncbi:putative type VI secretion system effector [Ideonella sp. YS5]|uniref:putative type VI secretion system effector n=1 Tax=Ideonella sp. YS5 TaxID=3453714 RepID=UPI003EECAE84